MTLILPKSFWVRQKYGILNKRSFCHQPPQPIKLNVPKALTECRDEFVKPI